jgi:hypothetical protein
MIGAVDVHFVLGFLVALTALVFSWNALGRRVVNAVLGLQVLAGLALVGVHVATHEPIPQGSYLHIGGALVALILYGLAARAGKRPEGGRVALLLSIAGLLCIAATLYLGIRISLAGGA